MSLPVGTKYYIPITIDKTKIASAMSNFPYQVDLSTKLAADSKFKSYITTAANIAVYDPVLNSSLPRIISLDLSNNKLLISFDSSTSTSVNKIFWICVGPTISQVNSINTFSNSNVANRWGCNEFSGTNLADSIGANNATLNGTCSLVAGTYGNRVLGTASNWYVNCGNTTVLNSANKFTIEMIASFSNVAGVDWVFSKLVDANNAIIMYLGGGRLYVTLRNASSASYGNFLVSGVLANSTPAHIVTTFDGTQSTDATKLKIYVNGVQKTLTFAGTQPTTLPNLAAGNLYFGDTTSGLAGGRDEMTIYSVVKDQNYLTTRYNQFFSAGSFWTIGSGISKKYLIDNRPYVGVIVGV